MGSVLQAETVSYMMITCTLLKLHDRLGTSRALPGRSDYWQWEYFPCRVSG